MSRMQYRAGRPPRPASHAGAGSNGSQTAHSASVMSEGYGGRGCCGRSRPGSTGTPPAPGRGLAGHHPRGQGRTARKAPGIALDFDTHAITRGLLRHIGDTPLPPRRSRPGPRPPAGFQAGSKKLTAILRCDLEAGTSMKAIRQIQAMLVNHEHLEVMRLLQLSVSAHYPLRVWPGVAGLEIAGESSTFRLDLTHARSSWPAQNVRVMAAAVVQLGAPMIDGPCLSVVKFLTLSCQLSTTTWPAGTGRLNDDNQRLLAAHPGFLTGT